MAGPGGRTPGDHLPGSVGAAHDADVEGAAAEVVDDDRAAGWDAVTEDAGEVRGRGEGLSDELRGGQAGRGGGVTQQAPSMVAPARRVVQHDSTGRGAQDPHRLGVNPAQDRSDGLDAATALADPRLLPALRAIEQRLGDRPDVSQAIKACADGR